MTAEVETRRQLAEVEAKLERLTNDLQRLEGQRDSLVLKLADNVGAHDRRPVAVR